jgi:hypothetical protein
MARVLVFVALANFPIFMKAITLDLNANVKV